MPVCEAKAFLVVFSSGLVDADNLACLAAEVTKRASHLVHGPLLNPKVNFAASSLPMVNTWLVFPHQWYSEHKYLGGSFLDGIEALRWKATVDLVRWVVQAEAYECPYQ